MRLTEGKQWIEALRKRWVIFSLGKVMLFSLALGLIVAAVLYYFTGITWVGFIFPFLLAFLLLSIKFKYWKISAQQIVRYVDIHFPEVEESSGLLLKPATDLSFLERLQAEKVNAALMNQQLPGLPIRFFSLPLIMLLVSVLFCFAAVNIPRKLAVQGNNQVTAVSVEKTVKENIPPQISSFAIRVSPPAYTGKSVREQKQFTILAENGAAVSWKILTSKPIGSMSFLFNDHELVKLKSLNEDKTSWSLSKTIVKPGFYQVVLDGKKSDFYQIEVIQDLPVAIQISKPPQHSTIDVGQPQQVMLNVALTDDYGITDAYIIATMASGKGEAVSFKEKKLPFSVSFNNKRMVKLNKLISLKDLGMKPGDELYFYINALDNHGQQSRSDTYFVSIQDTTELMSMAAIDNGINLVPEYFRSQRQIIIDTEKLLKEKPTLSETEFKTRSNNLGIDQKMLRLRYGKFLGEESEGNIGGTHGEAEESGSHDHEHEHEGAEAAPIGNVESIMDQYAHKHDNAEDATFFEPELKAQLKATLAEMWNAELRLRTYKTQEALPYEYKALRLLKDLQQKSRAYVAKTTIKTSPLKMEKRLTGELVDIKAGDTRSDYKADENNVPTLKRTIGLLENIKNGQSRSTEDLYLLMQAEKQLVAGAATSPARYLRSLQAIKKIRAAGKNGKINETDLAVAEKGVNSLLGIEKSKPFKTSESSSSALSKSYFNQLKRSAQ